MKDELNYNTSKLINDMETQRHTMNYLRKQVDYDYKKSIEEQKDKLDNVNVAMRWLYNDESIDVKNGLKFPYNHSNLHNKLLPFFEELLIGHTINNATKIANDNGFYFEHIYKDITMCIYQSRICYMEKHGIVTEIFLEFHDDILYEKYAPDPQL